MTKQAGVCRFKDTKLRLYNLNTGQSRINVNICLLSLSDRFPTKNKAKQKIPDRKCVCNHSVL